LIYLKKNQTLYTVATICIKNLGYQTLYTDPKSIPSPRYILRILAIKHYILIQNLSRRFNKWRNKPQRMLDESFNKWRDKPQRMLDERSYYTEPKSIPSLY